MTEISSDWEDVECFIKLDTLRISSWQVVVTWTTCHTEGTWLSWLIRNVFSTIKMIPPGAEAELCVIIFAKFFLFCLVLWTKCKELYQSLLSFSYSIFPGTWDVSVSLSSSPSCSSPSRLPRHLVIGYIFLPLLPPSPQGWRDRTKLRAGLSSHRGCPLRWPPSHSSLCGSHISPPFQKDNRRPLPDALLKSRSVYQLATLTKKEIGLVHITTCSE